MKPLQPTCAATVQAISGLALMCRLNKRDKSGSRLSWQILLVAHRKMVLIDEVALARVSLRGEEVPGWPPTAGNFPSAFHPLRSLGLKLQHGVPATQGVVAAFRYARIYSSHAGCWPVEIFLSRRQASDANFIC